VFCIVPSSGALRSHKVRENHLSGLELSKPLQQAGIRLSTINKQRQQYAPAFPYDDKHEQSRVALKWALSPVLLPPPPPQDNQLVQENDEEADKYYYPYYYNTQHTANLLQNTGEEADKYYYPYYVNTEDNADLYYQFDPWAAYYDNLASLAQGEKFEGPREELPQHRGIYDGPINIEENIIPDTHKIFLKSQH